MITFYVLTFFILQLWIFKWHNHKYLQYPKQRSDTHKKILNENPIIAILTWEFDIMNTGIPIESLPSTYTNFLESAGARTVPVSFKWSKEKIYETLDKVNGVLFTGGDIEQYNVETGEFHPYYIASRDILSYVLKKNKKGDYFPLFGIWQGFQFLHMAISNDPFILSDSMRWGENDTLIPYFTPFEQSRFFKNLNIDIYQNSPPSNPQENDENIEFNWHQFGVYLTQYSKYPSISNFF